MNKNIKKGSERWTNYTLFKAMSIDLQFF